MDKKILIIVIILLIGVIGYFGIVGIENNPFGSVSVSNEYQATSTYSGLMTGSACKTDVDHLVAYNQYAGTTLGSVVVVSTTPHSLKIKNATSTLSTGFYSGSSSTVATLPANLPQGTYTFDLYLDKGLVIDFENGFCGDYIFTYR